MNLLISSVRVTADTVVGTSGKPLRVYYVHLVSGVAASTCVLRNGTSASATIYAQIDGIANQGVVRSFPGGMLFPNGCFFDADANISFAMVGCDVEL